MLLSYLVNSLPGLVFQVPGPVINTTNPITVVSPSGVGGTWTITFPNGSKSTGSGSGSYTFSPQGGGTYAVSYTHLNKSWPDVEPLIVHPGKRYRLVFRNGSGDQHPIHLHRHTFEVTRIGEKHLSGLMKDVVNLMPLDTVEVDFVADNPGATLMHCHQQLHMDYGFMQLIKYSG